MSKLDNTPQPVREAIALALFVAAISATAANMLHQPLFLLGGVILFAVFYFWRISPQIKAAYEQQAEQENKYADDDTYQPILDRFDDDHNDDALIEQYKVWKQGPHDNEVRLRFLQEAILSLIDEGKIYRVEELMTEVEQLAEAEGLTDRFQTFRAECDRRIAEIAQQRLAPSPNEEAAEE
ncbi:MAG: hypothetical protein IJ111_03010 [Eggerthellaceae bacterium]|nr:hypothetical protein [Eggerthellaceae bacterium]